MIVEHFYLQIISLILNSYLHYLANTLQMFHAILLNQRS